MGYILLFLEGIITFISPCLLPLLPVYISFFAGTDTCSKKKSRTLINATGFVLGFTVIFVTLGAFAGIIGQFLLTYGTILNIITGLIVVLFGLKYLGILPKMNASHGKMHTQLQRIGTPGKPLSFPTVFVFGAVLSISWIPCTGVFLGAALLRASQQGAMAEGMFMLFVFSMGLGLPFIACALLIDKLKGAFDFIKRHYRVVNIMSGCLLVLVGVLMMTGIFGRFAALFVA